MPGLDALRGMAIAGVAFYHGFSRINASSYTAGNDWAS